MKTVVRELVGWTSGFYIIPKPGVPQCKERKDREAAYFLLCFQKIVYFKMPAHL